MERSEKAVLMMNLAIVLFFIFKWVYVYAVGNFFLLLFPLGLAAIFFFIACLWAFIHAIRWIGKNGTSSLNPLLLCAVTSLTVILVPLDKVGCWCNFWTLLFPRESIVHQIQNGTLEVKWHGSHLSGLGRFASMGGEVEAQGKGNDLKVLFIDDEGFLSDFSGYIYCGGNEPPHEGDFTMVNTEFWKLKDHWYYGISRN